MITNWLTVTSSKCNSTHMAVTTSSVVVSVGLVFTEGINKSATKRPTALAIVAIMAPLEPVTATHGADLLLAVY